MGRGKKTKSTAEIVRELIQKFSEQADNEKKISVGDFLRLLQVLKELDGEEGVDEVLVKWVERDKGGR